MFAKNDHSSDPFYLKDEILINVTQFDRCCSADQLLKSLPLNQRGQCIGTVVITL